MRAHAGVGSSHDYPMRRHAGPGVNVSCPRWLDWSAGNGVRGPSIWWA